VTVSLATTTAAVVTEVAAIVVAAGAAVAVLSPDCASSGLILSRSLHQPGQGLRLYRPHLPTPCYPPVLRLIRSTRQGRNG
jgi:hypothetical protein